MALRGGAPGAGQRAPGGTAPRGAEHGAAAAVARPQRRARRRRLARAGPRDATAAGPRGAHAHRVGGARRARGRRRPAVLSTGGGHAPASRPAAALGPARDHARTRTRSIFFWENNITTVLHEPRRVDPPSPRIPDL